MIIVESRHRHITADLEECDLGVAVTVWRSDPLDARGAGWEGAAEVPRIRKLLHREVLDCPFHVALDRVHDLVNNLETQR